MQKDVIYIDVEDDITAIIGKVKAAKEKVVALVPPKRIGVLQSAVNLRLLARTADLNNKHLVLITNNQALLALAGSAKIPVAKNLQSKPEIAEIPALQVDDDDDIIDGEQLPVGELARTSDVKKTPGVPASVISGIDIDDDSTRALPPSDGEKPGKPKSKNKIKVPSFNSFRKKLFIFGGLGILLIGFLVWAIWFAPHATVVIDARTTEVPIKTQVALGATLKTDTDAATVKSIVQEDKQESSVEFDATGTEEVGERAAGTLTLTRSAPGAVNVPFGAGFSNGECTFVTQSQVTVPGATPGGFNGSGFSIVPGTIDVRVQATAVGEQCNLSGRNYDSTVDGITAAGSQMAGGSKKTIKIVTAADVQKATQQLNEQKGDDKKAALIAKFDDGVVVIQDSFVANAADPRSEPAIGKEAASGKAKLTSEVTYTVTGVAKNDLSAYFQGAIEQQLTSKDDQRIYDDGVTGVKLTAFKQTGNNASVTIETTGKVGPKIDDDAIKEQVKGKRYGEIQSTLKEIEGVNDADTKFSPFWVRTVPNDVNKIKIEFKLQNASS
ncbi:MAG: hypothetical protein EOO17_02885 [Chloroflexi bacterium]|nr:MAG: hypothetical protein EOO17_02885 [Chloroflexota bacterium]